MQPLQPQHLSRHYGGTWGPQSARAGPRQRRGQAAGALRDWQGAGGARATVAAPMASAQKQPRGGGASQGLPGTGRVPSTCNCPQHGWGGWGSSCGGTWEVCPFLPSPCYGLAQELAGLVKEGDKMACQRSAQGSNAEGGGETDVSSEVHLHQCAQHGQQTGGAGSDCVTG